MSVLQKLIVKFNEKKNSELYTKIIKEIQSAEMLWIAFSPSSNNYYLGNENGKAAAYLFSEKDYFDAFYVHTVQKGYTIKVVENKAEYRMAFFADLYRSGFEAVVIDNGQTFLKLNLFDIIKKPQPQSENKDTRLIANPSLMRTACWFLQEDAKNPANPDMWKLFFTEIFKGEYIVPADTSKLQIAGVKSGEIKLGQDSEVSFPILENGEGKKFYPFFTDWNELRKYDMSSQFSAMAATFKDFERFADKADGIVINPFGANIVLTSEMLESIRSTAKDVKSNQSEIMVGEPKEYPMSMTKAMTEYFDSTNEVKSAYLKLMYKDSKKSYLVALDLNTQENPTSVFDRIAEKSLPHAEGIPIDFIEIGSDFAKKVFRNAEPFYRK